MRPKRLRHHSTEGHTARQPSLFRRKLRGRAYHEGESLVSSRLPGRHMHGTQSQTRFEKRLRGNTGRCAVRSDAAEACVGGACSAQDVGADGIRNLNRKSDVSFRRSRSLLASK